MARELLIAAGPGEWRAALLEDAAAVELYVERGDTRAPGSIHLGRVVQTVPGLDAVLVDIGEERPGFLPLGQVPPGVDAGEGARLVVQVRREAWQDKATRLTARLADRVALDKRAASLTSPVQLEPAAGFAAALRLRLPGAPDRVVADDMSILRELRAAFPDTAVERRSADDWPIDLDATFDAALSPSLALGRNGAIHIEGTRAATLIDVDTGSPATGSAGRSAVTANLAAARLIAREVRLRNIAGAIIVDFVGLDGRGPRERVRQALADALARDPAKPELLGWTRLGHIEIVRPRRARSLADAMLEPRAGQPARKLPVATAHDALRRLLREARIRPAATWRLTVPPAVEAALRGTAAPALRALEARLGRSIALIAARDMPADGFDIAPV
jgi:ribonuclease G